MCDKAADILQDLRELTRNHTLSMDVRHDVAANSSDLSTAYTVTSYADLQDYLGVTYACSVPSNSTLNAAVQACAGLNSRTCCVEYGRLSLTKVRLSSLKQGCADRVHCQDVMCSSCECMAGTRCSMVQQTVVTAQSTVWPLHMVTLMLPGFATGAGAVQTLLTQWRLNAMFAGQHNAGHTGKHLQQHYICKSACKQQHVLSGVCV